MSRAQALVVRECTVLMVLHDDGENQWWCLPGGAIDTNETPANACLRELFEECNVKGEIIRKVSEINYGKDENHYTFLVDIGDQVPSLGIDPELLNTKQILSDAKFMKLNEIPERDRVFVWAGGLVSIKSFWKIVEGWGNEISIP